MTITSLCVFQFANLSDTVNKDLLPSVTAHTRKQSLIHTISITATSDDNNTDNDGRQQQSKKNSNYGN